jgi:serpin B
MSFGLILGDFQAFNSNTMKQLTWLVLILLTGSLLLSACAKENSNEPKKPADIKLPAKASGIIASGNDFGINLFKQVAQSEDGNFMLSPLSASAALTMLLNGSSADTWQQISGMLGYGEFSQAEINNVYQSLVGQLLKIDPEVTLAIANAIWYHQNFSVKPPFLTTMASDFGAHTQALDFSSQSALNTINKWAADNTNGKIDKVLNEISPDAVMFIMNALYFKGTWTYPFDKDKTAAGPFYAAGGQTTEAEMMNGEFPFKTFYDNGVQVIELPYGQQNFVMDILLPDAGVPAFLNVLDAETWNSIIEGLAASQPVKATLVMPKFSFSYEKFLNDQLMALGMTDAFNPAMANLSGISDQNIFVSFVKQNTFVDVNEEGTEAAAVTTIGIELTSMPPAYVIDRPFIFAIRETITNTLLFIGIVKNPSA